MSHADIVVNNWHHETRNWP